MQPSEQFYCPQHADMKALLKKSVPRWVFVASLSAALSIAVLFGGWVQISMGNMEVQMNVKLQAIERHMREQISVINNLYVRDVERFYRAAEQNGVQLDGLQSELSALNSKVSETMRVQNLVLKKIDLAGNKSN